MYMQNDKTMMMNEKKEIMIRIESMEIQAQLRDGTSSLSIDTLASLLVWFYGLSFTLVIAWTFLTSPLFWVDHDSIYDDKIFFMCNNFHQ